MDDSVSITIKISEKEFSLRVNSQEEAAFLQDAAQKLNQRIMKRTGHLHISKEDILSMVAFDLMVSIMKESEKNRSMTEQLDNINRLLDSEFSE